MVKQQWSWTNSSVVKLAGDQDPFGVVTELARQLVFEAIDQGWEGPPFDPFQLASLRKIEVIPRDDVRDARILPTGSRGIQIEFNPNRPRARIRFSVAHELAHALFPDCIEVARYRAEADRGSTDDWQLELLCNVAASEILMPVVAMPDLEHFDFGIDSALMLAKEFDVSAEALLLRVARPALRSVGVFSAAKTENKASAAYRLDYFVPSLAWTMKGIRRGIRLPPESVVAECSAVGFTAKGTEIWVKESEVHVEALGIPPYPGHQYPRVVGFVKPKGRQARQERTLNFVRGDATKPRGRGQRLLVHVVNDKTPRWGAGFARAVRETWPEVQQDFIRWTSKARDNLSLGNIHTFHLNADTAIIHMIAQRGYGPSPTPRIRYERLRQCLNKVAEEAVSRSATVHMPRIGSGQAGGRWDIVSEIISETLLSRAIQVVVYDLPSSAPVGRDDAPPQTALNLAL